MKRKNLSVLSFVLIFLFTNLIFLFPFKQTFAQTKTKLIIHYAKDPNTDKDWNLWIWPYGMEGKKYEFTHKDDFGPYAIIEFEEAYDKVGFIVRTDNWEKDVAEDRFVDKFKNGVAEIWLLPGDPEIYYSKPDKKSIKKTSLGEKTKVTVHYFRYDGNYEGWNLWVWPFGKEGSAYYFTSEDKYGKVAEFYVEGTEGVDKLGIITRRSTKDNPWAEKEFGDRFITKFKEDGSAEIWLAQGDEKVHYSPSELDLSPKFVAATLDDMNIISAETNIPFVLKNDLKEDIVVKVEGKQIKLSKVEPDKNYLVSNNKGRKLIITTYDKLPLDKTITVEKIGYGSIIVSYGKVFSSEEFDKLYYYDGNDLGANYSKEQTLFKVWAPTASEAKLVIYSKWEDKAGQELPMQKGEKGVWSYTLKGDQHGTIYTYKVKIGSKWNEAVDPYARSVTVNGDKGVVLDLSRTNPEKWDPNFKPPFKNAVDAIIYELHVRDLSIHPDSGIKNKGKFLGLAETGTKGPNGTSTGLDHIKDLGVTHVQLLPIFDFASIDETSTKPQFNWGYDPKNYNAPEGSYSTNPYDPISRVKELKTAIQALHDNGLRVIMDVVYNHMFSADASNFNKLVPGYFFRTGHDGKLTNGSGCGNDTASERKMMRKFIIDSVTYWAKEYNIDGFRFDLMGLHDVETMNEVRKALDKIDPTIIIIGEGWDLNTALSPDVKANQKNAYKMPRIAHFNDTIRDAIKGSVFDKTDAGFVNGKDYVEFKVKSGIVGGIEYSGQIYTWGRIEPDQSVVYCEAHDNNTLYDKLKFTNPDATEEEIKAMHKLSGAIVLTSQGIPFIHAGQEFMRTKQGNENSYNASDEINRLDWERKAKYLDVVEYYKGLIKLRKEHPAFRMTTSDMIKRHLEFLNAPKNVIAYVLKDKANGDEWENIVVAFNGNTSEQTIKLPKKGKWAIVVDENKAGTEVIRTITGDTLKLPAKSAYVLYYKGSSFNFVYIALLIGLIVGILASRKVAIN
ncbi:MULTISPECIES: type I pullulanase [Caloramator]|uniref:pullulanase n=1 Tax=Caloramator australicus RC3 TaxID=857293 RepID=G0V465_9CLOT|nr:MULTISPECIES: type I pullulanase [Caloramator]MDO6354960.1 type I pullulanase [Caloramator sp. CAR-1]CCC57905.1 Pullulanase [Caloramator australicus RC3]